MSEIVEKTKSQLLQKWGHLGMIEGEGGACAIGHTPQFAPFAYLCRFFPALTDEQINEADAICSRPFPLQYRKFLAQTNGAELMRVRLQGAVGLVERNPNDVIGQPVSLRYQNDIERPDYIPEGHFGFGLINGNWYSQGHLYLTNTGEVELYNSHCDLIGARWESLDAFLENEVARQIKLHDADGSIRQDVHHLPQDTLDWEKLGEAHKAATNKYHSFPRRMLRFLARKN